MLATTGHSWREIYEDWDFPRLNAWIDYCNQHPTLQAMVQGYLGIKREKRLRITKDNFADFLSSIGSG